ncbi:toll/interleukin-1 receptor domain-containing protein [Streptomyces sp. NBC_00663]|uniref:hypothetical protein n=1 Tax=Streptomyces sp. NBC_00663 TaxID=2975801 RepID=UPI002E31B2B5|nr:hypothetical protein [Streptomyces sp. NBC_00663]
MAPRPLPGRSWWRWRRRAARPDAAAAGFDAFISYNHKADRARTAALRDGLHHFARPWYRLRAVRVFQDESSMSANPGLWPTIQDALSRSRHFVLLASPEEVGGAGAHACGMAALRRARRLSDPVHGPVTPPARCHRAAAGQSVAVGRRETAVARATSVIGRSR